MITVMMMVVMMTFFALPRRNVSQGCAVALAVTNQPCGSRCKEQKSAVRRPPLRGNQEADGQRCTAAGV